jgi:tellurite resistance protein TerC
MLSGLLERFHYLSKGLAIILGFIGVKLIMQATHKVISDSVPEIPSLVSLGVIVAVLAASIALSLRKPPADEHDDEPAPAPLSLQKS